MQYDLPILSYTGQEITNSKFSILIPSWNNLDILKICVASISKNSAENHQIIIHVNQGNDGTLEWVREQQLAFTHSFENVGVCHAMNAMAKLATTDYILYMNDDMYACPNWDKYLIDAIKENKDDYFYFSATMIEPIGIKNKCAITPHNFGLTATTFDEDRLLAFVKTVKKEDWHGASWPPSVVHKKLWDQVGGYGVAYSPGFGSDPDFSMKLWQAGVRNFRGIGSSLVYHFQSKSTERVVRNNGRLTFACNWGVPSSYFYKKILRLGETYNNDPLTFSKNSSYRFAQLRALWIKFKE
ncbi:glycosyltransferase family 2 protein [Flavobacterium sp. GT2N3]|uniref:glycosyltransferase family 2 protein n=1 Tax=unclassified Flavobacterium TaxID=196869 RepID=UPI003AAC9D47